VGRWEDSKSGSARGAELGRGGVVLGGRAASRRVSGVFRCRRGSQRQRRRDGGSVRGLPRSGIGGFFTSGLTALRQRNGVCEYQQSAETRPMSHRASVDGRLEEDSEGGAGRCGADTGPLKRMRSASNSPPRKRWAYPFLSLAPRTLFRISRGQRIPTSFEGLTYALGRPRPRLRHPCGARESLRGNPKSTNRGLWTPPILRWLTLDPLAS
jgi:hypothetical protein